MAPTISPNSFSARKVRVFIVAKQPVRLARHKRLHGSILLFELTGYPVVGDVQTIFEGNGRLPVQDFTQACIVAVATSHALGFREIVSLTDLLARYIRNYIHELVDRDHAILTKIDRLTMLALHQAIDTFDTVVDVAVGTSLFAVAPHFNMVAIICKRHLATDRCG